MCNYKSIKQPAGSRTTDLVPHITQSHFDVTIGISLPDTATDCIGG